MSVFKPALLAAFILSLTACAHTPVPSTPVVADAPSTPMVAPSVTTDAVALFKSCDKPIYPAESKMAKHEGTVTIGFLVDTNGVVQDTKIIRSSGKELLDVAARDALKLCKFAPATKDGKAVTDWAKIQYVWTLK